MNNQENLTKNGSVFLIELDKIEVNPYQPRIEFDQDKLEALANSIKQYGVLQPIIVSRKEEYSEEYGIKTKYQIIAGERRFRASKMAGLKQIPAIIREKEDTDSEKLEMAIIENLQREDLNPVDKAKAFKRLADEFGLKHNEIAKKMGKSREYVSNAMRILMLPDVILNGLTAGKISEGHTRSLLMLKDRPEEQAELYKRIVTEKLTVRAAEKIARSIATDKVRKKVDLDPEIKNIEEEIRKKLKTKVSIDQKPVGDGGKLTIEFFNKDDLKKIFEVINSHDIELSNPFNKMNIDGEIEDENEPKKFDDIQPTVFKEEIDKLEQFQNVPEKKNDFVGFSIGGNPENRAVEEDFKPQQSLEMNQEGEVVIPEPQKTTENIYSEKNNFSMNNEKEEQHQQPEEPEKKEEINNFSSGGFFKKFSFGFGTKKDTIEKTGEDIVDDIKSKNDLEKNTGLKNSFANPDLTQEKNEVSAMSANHDIVDGLKKIEVKNDFDRSRIDSFAKTDEILKSFGEHKVENKINDEHQKEINELLSGVNLSEAKNDFVSDNFDMGSQNNNPVLENQNNFSLNQEKIENNTQKINQTETGGQTNNYSNLYEEFLKSKNAVMQNEAKVVENNQPIQAVEPEIKPEIQTGDTSQVNNLTSETDLFGKLREPQIVEENSVSTDVIKQKEAELNPDVKVEVVSHGDGFLADAQAAKQNKSEEPKEEISPEDIDKKYNFKGFSL